jgi:hypothetical protein
MPVTGHRLSSLKILPRPGPSPFNGFGQFDGLFELVSQQNQARPQCYLQGAARMATVQRAKARISKTELLPLHGPGNLNESVSWVACFAFSARIVEVKEGGVPL